MTSTSGSPDRHYSFDFSSNFRSPNLCSDGVTAEATPVQANTLEPEDTPGSPLSRSVSSDSLDTKSSDYDSDPACDYRNYPSESEDADDEMIDVEKL